MHIPNFVSACLARRAAERSILPGALLLPLIFIPNSSHALHRNRPLRTAPFTVGRQAGDGHAAGTGLTKAATLADVLRSLPWNSAQNGSLLAVNPETVRRVNVPEQQAERTPSLRTELSAYNRTLLPAGTITVVAPTTMVALVDEPRQRPNPYDGLPRSLKVKYLLATLTDQQWKLLQEKGLGLDTLSGEQISIFQSLLPARFQYKQWQLDENGEKSKNIDTVTLPPDQRDQVRLRVFRSLQMFLPLSSDPRRRVNFDTASFGKPNAQQFVLEANKEDEEGSLFGVSLRSTVLNRIKPSHIDYASSRLDVAVPIQGANNVRDLIRRVAEATRLELYADLRVAELPVFARGGQVRAGDVLKALALATTGTFRKVDKAFLLTSDLTGMGARQLRLAEWQAQTSLELKHWEANLNTKLAQQGEQTTGMNAVGFAPTDPYALTPDVIQEVQKRRNENTSKRYLDPGALSPALQQLLANVTASYNDHQAFSGKLRDDAVDLNISIKLAFQLPDGRVLQPDSSPIGFADQFSRLAQGAREAPPSPLNAPAKASPSRLPLPKWAARRLLFITPRSSDSAGEAVQVARRLGFTDLVLNTDNATIVSAAVLAAKSAAKGEEIRIHAVVAPFEAPPGSPDPGAMLDRNLIGETSMEVWNARKALPRWRSFVSSVVGSSFPSPIPEHISHASSIIAPGTPETSSRFRDVGSLASTEGLAGLYLKDTLPDGYMGERPASNEINYANNLPLAERGNLGYTPALRLSFLREAGVDPIDLIPHGLTVGANLSLPFFPDPEAGSGSQNVSSSGIRELGARWDKMRLEANRAALSLLFATIRAASARLPLYMEARATLNNDASASNYWTAFAAWERPERLPVTSQAKGDWLLKPYQLSEADKTSARSTLMETLTLLQKTPVGTSENQQIAFDLTALPDARALALLNECIVAMPAP